MSIGHNKSGWTGLCVAWEYSSEYWKNYIICEPWKWNIY